MGNLGESEEGREGKREGEQKIQLQMPSLFLSTLLS